MGRGKLQMEMIGDEKTRYKTFGNRSKGLKKKLHELSTLCDVEACMILYHGDAADGPCSSRPDVWPENRDEVERIINRYLNERKEADRKRTLDLSNVLGSTKTKVEPEKNGKSEGQASWGGIELEGLSYEKLMELLEKLDKKIEDVDSLIDFKKKETSLTCKAPPPNCSRMANPLFQGSELVFYDMDFPDLSSGFLEPDLKNWMMMMNIENQEHQEFYVLIGFENRSRSQARPFGPKKKRKAQ